MGIYGLFKSITGFKDNVDIACDSIYKLYLRENCSFIDTFQIRYTSLFSELIDKCELNGYDYYRDAIEIFLSNSLFNFCGLVIADLNINAAPKEIPICDTLKDFSEEVCTNLLKRGLLGQYVHGNNSNTTYSFVNDFIKNIKGDIPDAKWD